MLSIVRMIVILTLTLEVYCTITTLFRLCLDVVQSIFLCKINPDIESQMDSDTDADIGKVLHCRYYLLSEFECSWFLCSKGRMIVILTLALVVYHTITTLCHLCLDLVRSIFLCKRNLDIGSHIDTDTDADIC